MRQRTTDQRHGQANANWLTKRRRVLALSVGAVGGLATAGQTGAATLYWNAGSDNANWNTTTPVWSTTPDGAATKTWTSGSTAYFSDTNFTASPFIANLDAATSVAGITFNAGSATITGSGAGVNGMTLTNTVTLNSTAVATTLDSSLGNIAVTTSQTFTNNSAADFTVAANLQPASANSNLTINGSGPTQISGTLQNSTQTLKLIYSGTGTLSLTGSNTYTNGTIINGGGTVKISQNSSLGTGAVSVTNNSIVDLNGCSLTQAVTLQNATVVNNTSTLSTLSGTNNTITEYTSTFGGTGDILMSGGIAHARVRKIGSGTLTLSGNNTYEFGTVIDGGTLKVGHANALGNGTAVGTTLSVNATLDLAGYSIASSNLSGSTSGLITSSSGASTFTLYQSGNTTYNGLISGAVSLSVVRKTLGTSYMLTLTGSNTYSGGTTITNANNTAAGGVQLGNPNALGTGLVTITNSSSGVGTTFDVNGQGTSSTPIPNNLTFSGVPNTVLNSNASTPAYLSGTISMGSTSTIFGGDGDITLAGIVSGSNKALTKSGNGALTLTASNTHSGATNITGGELVLSGAGAIASSSAITISAGATLDTTAKTGGFAALAAQILRFGLDSTGAGSAGLLQAGVLDISSAKVDFTTLGTLDDTYVIAKYSSLTGTQFAQVTNLPDGARIDYNYQQGNQIAVVVPEPAAFVLLGTGMVAAMSRRRRGK